MHFFLCPTSLEPSWWLLALGGVLALRGFPLYNSHRHPPSPPQSNRALGLPHFLGVWFLSSPSPWCLGFITIFKNKKNLPHPQESACSKPDDDILDIPLDDPGANAAAAKIQASFRGHMARKKIKSGECGRKGPGPGGPGGAGGARGGAGGGPSGD